MSEVADRIRDLYQDYSQEQERARKTDQFIHEQIRALEAFNARQTAPVKEKWERLIKATQEANLTLDQIHEMIK